MSCTCWEATRRCREGKDEAVGGWWMQRWKFSSRQQHGQSEKLHTSVTPRTCGWEPWKKSEPDQGGTQTPDWRNGRQLLRGPSYHWFLMSGLKAWGPHESPWLGNEGGRVGSRQTPSSMVNGGGCALHWINPCQRVLHVPSWTIISDGEIGN